MISALKIQDFDVNTMSVDLSRMHDYQHTDRKKTPSIPAYDLTNTKNGNLAQKISRKYGKPMKDSTTELKHQP